MRLRIASLRRRIKGDLRIEFVRQDLTSYGGLELVRRYFRLLDLHRRLRRTFSAYGPGSLRERIVARVRKALRPQVGATLQAVIPMPLGIVLAERNGTGQSDQRLLSGDDGVTTPRYPGFTLPNARSRDA